MKTPLRLFWLRRDLRLQSNPGLIEALQGSAPVQCIFIFDTEILDKLPHQDDARVQMIHQQLKKLNTELNERGSELWVFHGQVLAVMRYLLQNHSIDSVYHAQDYEPQTLLRDQQVQILFESQGIPVQRCKDHLIHSPKEVIKADGSPYTVFTPYFKAWKQKLQLGPSRATLLPHFHPRAQHNPYPIPPLASLGFIEKALDFPLYLDKSLISQYAERRDFPAQTGTSHAGIHLRFGTVDPLELARLAQEHSEVWLSELAWRDFFAQILFHFPHSENQAFKSIKDPKWNEIPWQGQSEDFEKWKEGQTGYPWVDAGMREFKATAWMHNRVRMAVASFLCKHLLIDWKWGERYFAESLLDYDLSSNVGNWQWAAGTGCDAQPWFRIFNPELQAQKFDPQGEYLRKWLPEWGSSSYPKPMIEHSYARQRALVEFGRVLKDSSGQN